MEHARRDPLARYQTLQVVSIVLILVGVAAVLAALAVEAALVAGGLSPGDERFAPLLFVVLAGGLALVAGLAMNAVRAVVVREVLPAGRYRGPSIIVLVLIATVLTGVASVGLTDQVGGVMGLGDELTVGGSLLVLTATQLGLLAVAAIFVLTPRALEGARLLPDRGLGRSILVGIGLAIPAWIAAQLLGVLAAWLLSLVGLEEAPGIAETALENVEPWVLVLAIVIVAPLAEEYFFRGVAYNAWNREYGTARAILGSAALFAIVHASIFALVPIFFLGLVLAELYRRTHSLPGAIAMHATFNAISVTLALLIRFDIVQLPLPT